MYKSIVTTITIACSLSLSSICINSSAFGLPDDSATASGQKATTDQLKTLNQTIHNALKAYVGLNYQPSPGYYDTNNTNNQSLIAQQLQNNDVNSTLQDVQSLLQQFKQQTVPASYVDNTVNAADSDSNKGCKPSKGHTCSPPRAPMANLQHLTIGIRGTDNLNQNTQNTDGSPQDTSFSYSSFMNNPITNNYTYDAIASKNYLDLLTNSYGFNVTWFNNQAMTTLHNKLNQLLKPPKNLSGVLGAPLMYGPIAKTSPSSRYNQFIDKLQSDSNFLAYKANYRSAIATHSMIVGTLLDLQKERECGTKPGSTTPDCSNHPSPLALQHTIDTWRVSHPSWYKYISSASSTTLMREMVVMQAENLANQYQAHVDREKTEALLALLNEQTQNQSNAMNIPKTTQLQKIIENDAKPFLADDKGDSDSDSSDDSSNTQDQDQAEAKAKQEQQKEENKSK